MKSSHSSVLNQVIVDLQQSCDVTSHAFFEDDGKILFSKMSEENTKKMSKIVKFYSRQMRVNNYFVQQTGSVQLVLYRISQSVFLIFISKTDIDVVVSSLKSLFEKHSASLDALFHEVPDSFKKIVRYLVISQSREMGPEPMAFYPPELDEGKKLKITLKSMLLLTAERDGAIRGIPATIPFIEYHSMGIIFLFDVPNADARGGAYDSCISILVDESYRPAIYENMYLLENACIEIAEKMKAGSPIDEMVSFLLEKLEFIKLSTGSTQREDGIERLMKEQLRRITKEL